MSDQLHKQHTDEAAEAPAAAAAAALVRLSFGQSVPSTPLVGKDFGVVVSADRFGLEIELFCSLVAAADAPECDSPGQDDVVDARKKALAASPVLGRDSGQPILRVHSGSTDEGGGCAVAGSSANRGTEEPLANPPGHPMLMTYTGAKSFRVTIVETSKEHGNRPMRLVVRGRVKGAAGASSSVQVVVPAVSRAFRVMRYRLDFDILKSNLPGVWYRDGQGRDNYLTAAIQLTGVDGKESREFPRVPLTFAILYEDQTPVPDQKILKARRFITTTTSADVGSGASSQSSSSNNKEVQDRHHKRVGRWTDENGRCEFLFRILDVSSKHKKQRFRIRVQPNLVVDPSCTDVSFRDSAPIRVVAREARSKRSHDAMNNGNQLNRHEDGIGMIGAPRSRSFGNSSDQDVGGDIDDRRAVHGKRGRFAGGLSADQQASLSAVNPRLTWKSLGEGSTRSYASLPAGSMLPQHPVPVERYTSALSDMYEFAQGVEQLLQGVERGNTATHVGRSAARHFVVGKCLACRPAYHSSQSASATSSAEDGAKSPSTAEVVHHEAFCPLAALLAFKRQVLDPQFDAAFTQVTAAVATQNRHQNRLPRPARTSGVQTIHRQHQSQSQRHQQRQQQQLPLSQQASPGQTQNAGPRQRSADQGEFSRHSANLLSLQQQRQQQHQPLREVFAHQTQPRQATQQGAAPNRRSPVVSPSLIRQGQHLSDVLISNGHVRLGNFGSGLSSEARWGAGLSSMMGPASSDMVAFHPPPSSAGGKEAPPPQGKKEGQAQGR